MVMLVTLRQASDHLRRDSSDDDSDLVLKIHAASSAVLNYLKDGASFLETAVIASDDGVDSTIFDGADQVYVDASGELAAPFEVRAATLLLIGYLYKNRDADPDKEFEMGYLPRPVMSLLYPLRKPTLE